MRATFTRVAGRVSAGAVIALAGVASVAAPASAAGPGPAGSAAHPPAFYIVRQFEGGTTVRATATSAVTASVRCPQAGAQPGALAAQADNRTFYLVCQSPTAAKIYRFRLTSAGKIPSYSAVRGGTFTGDRAGALAVSANGSLVAVGVAAQQPGSLSGTVVITTKTGAHGTWSGRDLPGGVIFSGGELSFADNGRVLAVFGRARCLKSDPACKSPDEEMLELSPAARGGQLSSGKVVFTQGQVGPPSKTFINEAYLSSDGSTVTLSLLGDGLPPDSVSVVQRSAVTGNRIDVPFRLVTGNGFSYSFVSTDATGRWVLFDAGPSRASVFGWIRDGKLVRLKPAGSGISFGAW